VGDLAKCVEDLSFDRQHVERLKDEFYQLCADYIDKKKTLCDKNHRLKSKLHTEREYRVDLLKQIEAYKGNLTDLRKQITQLFTELDASSKLHEGYREQKNAYKAKLRAANQRLRTAVESIDQIALVVAEKLLNA